MDFSMNTTKESLPFFECVHLKAFEKHGVQHRFFTRKGGVSCGFYDSLNCSFAAEDARRHVEQNRQRIVDQLSIPIEALCTLSQVHGSQVVCIHKENYKEKHKADAMVTRVEGLALGILTADCGPLLFVDPEARIIGAAHGGWRGLLDGIIEKTVLSMEHLGASRTRIYAALGPCIGPCHYEIDQTFYAQFIDKDPTYKIFFSKQGSGACHFNLWAFTQEMFARSSIKGETANSCTYAQEELFFSYRRSTHKGESDYGRQLSLIMLEKTPAL